MIELYISILIIIFTLTVVFCGKSVAVEFFIVYAFASICYALSIGSMYIFYLYLVSTDNFVRIFMFCGGILSAFMSVAMAFITRQFVGQIYWWRGIERDRIERMAVEKARIKRDKEWAKTVFKGL